MTTPSGPTYRKSKRKEETHVNRDQLMSGNGKEIAQHGYHIINAIQGWPKPMQVQAVAIVFVAMLDSLKMRPPN